MVYTYFGGFHVIIPIYTRFCTFCATFLTCHEAWLCMPKPNCFCSKSCHMFLFLMLQVCPPDLCQTCPHCKACNWHDPVEVGATSTVAFLHSAVVHVCFPNAHCKTSECKGMIQADGLEYGLLRMTDEFAFGIDLLYSVDLSLAHTFPSFHKIFQCALDRDANLQAMHGTEEAYNLKQSYLSNRLRLFQRAFFDFVALQHIDYAASFSCPHATSGDLTIVIDGITLGTKQSQSLILCPWAANYSSDVQVHGSEFSSRVFMEKAKMRRLLRAFGEEGTLETVDFNTLRSHMVGAATHEQAFVPFLDMCIQSNSTGKVELPLCLKSICLALGSTASVCQIAKPVAWSVLQEVSEVGNTSVDGMHALMLTCPTLYNFLLAASKEPGTRNYHPNVRFVYVCLRS